MRSFVVTEKNGKVDCDKEILHVPPNIHEDIGVFLDESLVGKYKVKVRLQTANFLTKKRLNSSMIVLHDHNTAPGEDKFTIELESLTGAKDPTPLDPRVVNEP
jgi:hypothetical protein